MGKNSGSHLGCRKLERAWLQLLYNNDKKKKMQVNLKHCNFPEATGELNSQGNQLTWNLRKDLHLQEDGTGVLAYLEKMPDLMPAR